MNFKKSKSRSTTSIKNKQTNLHQAIEYFIATCLTNKHQNDNNENYNIVRIKPFTEWKFGSELMLTELKTYGALISGSR